MSESRCAYPRCQAGGVILLAARYVAWSNDEYHPGCWAVERRRLGEGIGRALDRLTTPAAILVEGCS